MLKDLETIKAREEELERMKEQMSLASKTVWWLTSMIFNYDA
jgi:hypothetical protein